MDNVIVNLDGKVKSVRFLLQFANMIVMEMVFVLMMFNANVLMVTLENIVKVNIVLIIAMVTDNVIILSINVLVLLGFSV